MSIKAEKAKAMMYKKAALAELNIETIVNELEEICVDCDEVEYFMSDEESLIDALDGDEETEYEFKMMFCDLAAESEHLFDTLNEIYITEHFNDLFVGIMSKGFDCYEIVGFDSYEEDYFHLSSFETNWAKNESAKRLKRLTKDELLSVCGQCFGIAMSYINVKFKYEHLKATFDILKGENGAILKAVKEIERLYNDMFDDDYINREAENKFNKYLNHLPERIWIE